MRPLQQITPTEIDTLYIQLEGRLSSRTVHHIHTVLGSCLNAAVRKGLLISNPVKRAEAPPAGDSDAGQVLDQEGLAALLTGFRGLALYPIVATAAFTGEVQPVLDRTPALAGRPRELFTVEDRR